MVVIKIFRNMGGNSIDRQMHSAFLNPCYPLPFLPYIPILLLNLETAFPHIVDIPFNPIPQSPII